MFSLITGMSFREIQGTCASLSAITFPNIDLCLKFDAHNFLFETSCLGLYDVTFALLVLPLYYRCRSAFHIYDSFLSFHPLDCDLP